MSGITANIQQKLFYDEYGTYVDVFRLKELNMILQDYHCIENEVFH